MSYRYVYIWSFRVRVGREREFLVHYSPEGTWAKLFAKASRYRGSDLLQDKADPRRYVTIDRWESEQSHRDFRTRFGAEYEDLDRRCADLTEDETALGEYLVADGEAISR